MKTATKTTFVEQGKAPKRAICPMCGESIRADEPAKLVRTEDGIVVRTGTFCPHHDNADVAMEHDSLFRESGDARWFIHTDFGPRCGQEWTGVRCEDAPCCGCC